MKATKYFEIAIDTWTQSILKRQKEMGEDPSSYILGKLRMLELLKLDINIYKHVYGDFENDEFTLRDGTMGQ